jgi:hypothetical protein
LGRHRIAQDVMLSDDPPEAASRLDLEGVRRY